jgi:transglutaminase-like putative cysteine protease
MAHLRPRALENQTVHLSELEVTPAPRGIQRRRDYFGNDSDVVEVLDTHDCLQVTCRSVVTVQPPPLIDVEPSQSPSWQVVASQLRDDPRYLREREFAFDSPLVRAHPSLREYAERVFVAGKPVVEAILELNRLIFGEFKYEPAATDVSTPLGRVLRERRGVCQDFAHVAIGCLRSVGLAGRYVSGYMETIPPPGKPKLIGADASHAWPAVFIPELGWLDFDPTNGILPSDRHIWVGWGRDFSDVSPLRGVVVGGGRHSLTVGVDVELREAA